MCILSESYSHSHHYSHSRQKITIRDPRGLDPLIHDP